MLSFALLIVRQGVEMGVLSKHSLRAEQSSVSNAREKCVTCLEKFCFDLQYCISHFHSKYLRVAARSTFKQLAKELEVH